MLRIIHTADLHLDCGEAKAYSFSVLDEIVSLANTNVADYLVLAGDVFNTFADLESGAKDFRESLAKLRAQCEVIYIAGNHENLERKGKQISSYELGISRKNIVDFDAAPLQLLEFNAIEFLCIPHQKDYAELSKSQPLPHSEKPRIAVAHGILTGSSFAGLVDDEEGAVIIDESIFAKHGANYVCLGHIHKATESRIGGATARYPGSPRVWRKGETGQRCVNQIEVNGNQIRDEQVPLNGAGEYRKVDYFVSLDGNQVVESQLTDKFGPHDYVHVIMQGIAEDEIVKNTLRQQLTEKFKGKCRKLEIDSDRVSVLSGISGNSLAKKFLAAWEQGRGQQRSGVDALAWARARELGLEHIKKALEK